jgi:Neurochondrin
MAEPSSTPSNISAGQSQTGNLTAALGQVKGLLSAKDDTSRFVGLAILKSVLDSRPELRQDVAQVKALWEAISAKFLDKLLRARENQKITREEAKDMVDIAVAVIHTFAIMLPTEYLDNDKLIRRSTALTNAMVQR